MNNVARFTTPSTIAATNTSNPMISSQNKPFTANPTPPRTNANTINSTNSGIEDEPAWLQGLPDVPEADTDPETTVPHFRMPEIMFDDRNTDEPGEID